MKLTVAKKMALLAGAALLGIDGDQARQLELGVDGRALLGQLLALLHEIGRAHV